MIDPRKVTNFNRTPRGEKYLELEKVFLKYCVDEGKTPADMDLAIWNSRHIEKPLAKDLTK